MLRSLASICPDEPRHHNAHSVSWSIRLPQVGIPAAHMVDWHVDVQGTSLSCGAANEVTVDVLQNLHHLTAEQPR